MTANMYITEDGAWRAGTFKVRGNPENWEDALRMAATLRGCIVLRCEHYALYKRFEYEALHPDFEPVQPGETVPEYVAEITCEVRDDEAVYTRARWRRAD